MNRIILSGNLGHGAQVREVPKREGGGSVPVVNFSLAVKLGFGRDAETVWYACAWWGEHAARVSEWLTRGQGVLLEGEPSLRVYEKRDKSMGAEITVRVDRLELVGGAGKRDQGQGTSDQGPQGDPGGAAAPASRGAVEKAAAEKLYEDVPF